jgi:hypothetical protein
MFDTVNHLRRTLLSLSQMYMASIMFFFIIKKSFVFVLNYSFIFKLFCWINIKNKI